MKRVFLLLFAMGLFTTTISCREKTTGEKVEDAADDIADDVSDAVD